MLGKLKVGQRLVIGSALLCLLAGALAGIGYREIATLRVQLQAALEAIGNRAALREWQGSVATNAARTVAILRSDDPKLAERLADDIKSTTATVDGLQQRIESMTMSANARGSLQAVATARAEYLAALEQALKLKAERSADAAKVFDRLEMPVLIEIATQIAPRKMSDILGLMATEAAERLTVEMARRAGSDKSASAADLPKIEGKVLPQKPN